VFVFTDFGFMPIVLTGNHPVLLYEAFKSKFQWNYITLQTVSAEQKIKTVIKQNLQAVTVALGLKHIDTNFD
jgi:hypothetical protein